VSGGGDSAEAKRRLDRFWDDFLHIQMYLIGSEVYHYHEQICLFGCTGKSIK
jgi:hypothetical protein